MSRHPGSARVLGAATVTVALFVALALPRAGTSSRAAGRYRADSRRVAPGVTLTNMVDRRGPNRISVLRVDPSRVTIDLGLAKNALPGLQTTSEIARRKGALAAINGDYFLTQGHDWMGRPVNTYAEDAELKASPLIWGRNFSLAYDRTTAYMGHFPLKVSLLAHDTGETWAVPDWNEGGPRARKIAGFTPAGGSSMTPPRDTCAVRLLPATGMQWHPTSSGVVQDLTVDASRCGADAMARRGGIVVAAQVDSRGLLLVQSLVPGETVRLTWSLGLPGVVETVGGNPLLMEDGRLAAGTCEGSSFCMRNPRTGIGMTAGGKLLLVVVDGRWKKSVGMTPAQFARLFHHLGATDAINLDGGGSSTMVVRDRVVNRPSDGHQRRVANALLILPFQDPEEPAPAASPPATPTPYATPTPSPSETGLPIPDLPPETPERSACLSAVDPASAGGYLEALTGGAFGHEFRARRAPLRRTIRIFTGAATCAGVTSTRTLRALVSGS